LSGAYQKLRSAIRSKIHEFTALSLTPSFSWVIQDALIPEPFSTVCHRPKTAKAVEKQEIRLPPS
jgi:hypothetical protein